MEVPVVEAEVAVDASPVVVRNSWVRCCNHTACADNNYMARMGKNSENWWAQQNLWKDHFASVRNHCSRPRAE